MYACPSFFLECVSLSLLYRSWGAVIISKLHKQIYMSEFEPQWKSHSYGLVPQLSKNFCKLKFLIFYIWYVVCVNAGLQIFGVHTYISICVCVRIVLFNVGYNLSIKFFSFI